MFNSSLIYKLYYDWWKNIDKSILLLIILLFSLGLFFSLVSTSLIASDKLDTNSYYFFFKHLFYIGIAIFFVIFFSSINQANLFRTSIVLFIICFIFLILVPIIGIEVRGSKRWLEFPFLPRFQPIELLKPFIIIMVASVLSTEKGKNIYCDGGAEVINELLKHDLIDEFAISIIPILLGSGKRLFEDGRPEQILEFVEVKTFDTGLTQLHYRRKE